MVNIRLNGCKSLSMLFERVTTNFLDSCWVEGLQFRSDGVEQMYAGDSSLNINVASLLEVYL
jgi:hypothetical protein